MATGVSQQVYFLQSVEAITLIYFKKTTSHKSSRFLDDVTQCAVAAGLKEGKEHKITARRRLGLRPSALCTEYNRQNQDCRLQLIKIATEPHSHTYTHIVACNYMKIRVTKHLHSRIEDSRDSNSLRRRTLSDGVRSGVTFCKVNQSQRRILMLQI